MSDKKNFVEKLEALQDSKINKLSLTVLKRLKGTMLKFAMVIAGYSFMSWVFLSLFDRWGFERTLIILLVGVFWYGIRK